MNVIILFVLTFVFLNGSTEKIICGGYNGNWAAEIRCLRNLLAHCEQKAIFFKSNSNRNTEYDYQETPKVDCCDKMKDAIEVNTSKKIIEIETKFMDKIKIIENMMHDKIRRIEIRIENDQKKREKHFKLMTKKTNLFNGYEYIYVDEKADWYSAQSNCVVWGGNLVSIHSEQENEFVRRLNKNVIWSGLNDIQNESVWVYSDGTSARAFFNWKLNQPDNSEFNENCVEIDNFGKMSDIFCFMSRNYICKR